MNKKNTLNFNMNLRIFGIVVFVVFFAVFSIYYIISSHQWNTVLTDAKTNLDTASVYINTEATFYINSSITLVSNNEFSKILKTDYTNTEEKLSAYTKIAGFFNMLSVPSANPKTLFTIYTANTSLLPCKYVKTMDEIPMNDADTLIYRIKFSDIIWNTENGNSFVFYRNLTAPEQYVNVLRTEIPSEKINTYINSISSDKNIVTLEDVKGKNAAKYENTLINGKKIVSYVPCNVKRDIYVKNLAAAMLCFLCISLVMFLASFLLTNNLTKKIYIFIDSINNDDILNEPTKAEFMHTYDEFSPIKQKIIDLLEAKHNLSRRIEEVNRNNNLLELQLLQAKFNPHLLYNTLSVIKWNVMSETTDNIAPTIDLLTTYYRHVLNLDTVIPIREEFKFLEQYVHIMEFAHSERYNAVFEADEEVLEIRIIKLMLQPLVENAILHGLNHRDNAKIKVSAVLEEGTLVLRIEDNGYGIPEEKLAEIRNGVCNSVYKSYGIRNTTNLLTIYFGKDNFEFTINSEPDRGTVSEIKIFDYRRIKEGNLI